MGEMTIRPLSLQYKDKLGNETYTIELLGPKGKDTTDVVNISRQTLMSDESYVISRGTDKYSIQYKNIRRFENSGKKFDEYAREIIFRGQINEIEADAFNLLINLRSQLINSFENGGDASVRDPLVKLIKIIEQLELVIKND